MGPYVTSVGKWVLMSYQWVSGSFCHIPEDRNVELGHCENPKTCSQSKDIFPIHQLVQSSIGVPLNIDRQTDRQTGSIFFSISVEQMRCLTN